MTLLMSIIERLSLLGYTLFNNQCDTSYLQLGSITLLRNRKLRERNRQQCERLAKGGTQTLFLTVVFLIQLSQADVLLGL